jgi:HAMP domain-containing protein/putative methionine-R-sulfoxide reductase with GAF domain
MTNNRSTSPGRRRTSLSRRMTLVLLPLVLLPLLAMGSASYLRARAILRDQASSQLTAIAQSQVQALHEWANVRDQALLNGTRVGAIQSGIADLEARIPNTAAYDAKAASVLTELNTLQLQGSELLFDAMLVARLSDGKVMVSNRTTWNQMTLSAITERRLPMDFNGTRPLYNDPELSPGGVALLSTAPLRIPGASTADYILMGVNGDLGIGTLLGEMQTARSQRGGLALQRGAIYMALQPDVVLRIGRFAKSPEAIQVTNLPVFAASASNPTQALEYTDLGGESVLGAYQTFPEWNLAIVVESPLSVVYSGLNTLAPFTAILISLAVLLTIIVVGLATRRLLSPLGVLAEFADRIAQGDWEFRVPAESGDELGTLGAALNRMAEELRGLYRSLEARVEARTRQIRTASEIARAVTSSPSLDDLLLRAVELIKGRFNYYHVSIFLLNEDRSQAVLRESTGEVGQALKARHHSLGVGSQSIIGWVTANNQARIASDVSQDPVHFRNELLPETRAEAAVPLQVAGQVLGALDVQSTDPAAFSNEDIELLQTLADQLSAAIQNARLAQTSSMAADRARMVSEVTSQFSGLMELDEVLETAARALHNALGRPEIMVKLTQHGDGEQPPPRAADAPGD